MVSKKNLRDNEISYDHSGERSTTSEDRANKSGSDNSANPIIDYMLEQPYSHVEGDVAIKIADYLASYHSNKDKLHCFVAAAKVTPRQGTGIIGVMESVRIDTLYAQVNDLRLLAARGVATPLCAGVGALFPINLFELHAGLAWLREQDDETYRRLVKDGMRSAGDLFDADLQRRPHLLLASADVRGVVTGDQMALARYVVKKHVNLGCSILLTVSDSDTIQTGAFGQLTKGIKTFELGRF